MAATYELIMQSEKELNSAKGEIAAGPVTDRLIDVCELLLEVVGQAAHSGYWRTRKTLCGR